MPKFPSIPTPIQGNPSSYQDALMAMKQALEMLMGTRGDQPATRTFVDTKTPQAVSKGDLWVEPNSGRLSYWTGRLWQQINVT